jgi:hypothetical protein
MIQYSIMQLGPTGSHRLHTCPLRVEMSMPMPMPLLLDANAKSQKSSPAHLPVGMSNPQPLTNHTLQRLAPMPHLAYHTCAHANAAYRIPHTARRTLQRNPVHCTAP